MCIIALAHRASARHPLIVAANRDERHARPTRRADWWSDAPGVLGGRDAEAGGTWLAISRDLRLAAVTNVRDSDAVSDRAGDDAGSAARSRGLLVSGFLSGRSSAAQFTGLLNASATGYRPFNLVLLDGDGLHYASNRARPRRLDEGVHALSNAPLDDEWPKVVTARRGLEAVLDEADPTEALFALLAERRRAEDGYGDREVSLFQQDPYWGTRSSTVIVVDGRGVVRFTERSFDAAGRPTGEASFEFLAEPPRAAAR